MAFGDSMVSILFLFIGFSALVVGLPVLAAILLSGTGSGVLDPVVNTLLSGVPALVVLALLIGGIIVLVNPSSVLGG